VSVAGSSTGRNWLWIGQALLALLLLVPAMPAQATAPARLDERCRIAADASTPLPDILRRLERCEARPPSSYRGTVWIAYAPPFVIDAKTWRLALDNHRVRGVDLWMIAPGGAAERVSYDPNARDREWLAGNYFSILFTAHGPVEQLVLRLTDAETHTFVRTPKLARAKDFAPIERNEAALYGVSVGMLALTILFHLSLFFAMRRRFQLIYCAHVGLLFGYALCYSGMIRMLAPELSAGGISRMLSFTMAAATGTGLAFIIEFLKTSIPRGVRRWAFGAAVGSGLAAAA
jgi:two-component system, sensor histidine kinase LadS